ncbi:MAG: hypothetical protein EAZ08_10375 [Cytophagales bacterium]|nr:MAG: hypothetical protein EAZ08_10375 [Cytophagales bacterium]
MKISLALFFIFSNIIALFAQQSPEKQGLNALFQRDLPKAEQLFQDLLKANKNNLIANYGLSHVYFEQQQTLKQKQQYQIKYLNFEPHFSLLRKAYFHAIIASDLFKQLPENEKEKMKKIANVTADAIQLQQRNKIPQEAYSLLTNAPYRLSYQKLYESNIYNRYTEADTLISLRENLLQQCADFAKDYPTSPFLKNVKEYRREMLKDYINLLSLRQFGDRSGSIYEKFCDLAITDFDSAELKHVVPSFYGAYFGFTPKNYSSNPNYLKLQTFANNYKLSVIQLLCELNLHHLGYRESKAQFYDAFIRTFAPADIALVAVKKMASPHLSTQNWKSAISIFEKYKPLFSNQAKNFNFDKMIALLSEAEGERKLVNLGKEINSEAKEYSPVLSLDGTTLYFARKGANTGEDIYFSEYKEGKWQPSFPLSQRVNTNTHEVPLTISPDGNTLYIYGNYAELPDFFYTKEKFLGKGDLYFVEKKGVTNGQITWDKMQVLPEPINSPHYEAGLSMATNGKAILFGSDRSGNIGGYLPNYHPDFLYYHGAGEFNIDIYVCEKTENGWSAPINLGETINTPFAEMNPYLHPDGKTLYFCSDGHYGLGGYDIFMSKRLDENSWTKWSEPVNLGKVINTAYNDNFFITADGATALIANTKKNDNYGLSDIYSIEVPQSKRPEPVKLIRGKITNVENKAISTAIKWQEISNSKNSGAAKSDEKGDFILLLNGGKKYVYFTDDEQIFGSSVEIDLSGKDWKSTKFETDIVVGTIDKNKPINLPFTLPTLHFDYNKDIIRNESFFDLDRLVALLQKNTSIKLSIEGHTDSDGNDAFNLALSERRAEAVKKYLLSKNCKNTIMAEGFGKSKAKTSNETEKGKQQNRRVEFRVSF